MPPTIAILGGTGAEGFGLASRFTRAGAAVLLGSRDFDRARAAAARLPGATGLVNPDAAGAAALVILAVPLQAQVATLESVRGALRPGAILVDTTVPLPPAAAPEAGSAALQAARHVPAGVAVAAAFHCLSARLLADLARPVDSDVLVCADDEHARAAVRGLVEMIPGARAVDAGPLANAHLVETLAALLITLNRRHKVKHAGVRITGLP